MDLIFSISNFLTIPFWALMILLPHWSWSKRIIGSLWIVAPAAVAYIALLSVNIATSPTELGAVDLALVQTFLGSPDGAVIGWLHFLAFDLFVGRWVYLDNQQQIGLPTGLVSLILLFVFLLGPVGFFLYLIARTIKTRRVGGG